MDGLSCSTCGHNLSGVPASRCPQCGEVVEAAVRRGAMPTASVEAPSLPRAIVRLVWPPLLVVLSPLPAIILPHNDLASLSALLLVVVSLLLVLTYGLFNSFAVARSLYAGRARAARRDATVERGTSPPRLLGFGLYFGQLTFFLSACSYFLKEYVFAYG